MLFRSGITNDGAVVVANSVGSCGPTPCNPDRYTYFHNSHGWFNLTQALWRGGAPLDGPRHMWWNFVSSSPDRIERAKADPGVCGVRLYVESENRVAQDVYRRVGLKPASYSVFETDFVLGHAIRLKDRPNEA